MKLQLTMFGRTTTIENDNEHATILEMLELFADLLHGAGYVFDGSLDIINESEVKNEEDND